jgi:hypothetical protein
MATKPKVKEETPTEQPKQEVAVVEQNKAPAVAEGFEGLATGFELMTPDNLVIPFITILQGLSPQMETVEGARLGHILNTGTNELLGQAVNFVGVRVDHAFMEWKPNRGGLAGRHQPNSPVVADLLKGVGGDRFAKLINEKGNQIVDTWYLFGVIADDNLKPMGYGCLAFKSTGIKAYNKWWNYAGTLMERENLPIMAVCYKWTVWKEKNDKGEFFSWKHALAKPTLEESKVKPGTPLYEKVIGLAKTAKVEADHSKESGDNEGGTDKTM